MRKLITLLAATAFMVTPAFADNTDAASQNGQTSTEATQPQQVADASSAAAPAAAAPAASTDAAAKPAAAHKKCHKNCHKKKHHHHAKKAAATTSMDNSAPQGADQSAAPTQQ